MRTHREFIASEVNITTSVEGCAHVAGCQLEANLGEELLQAQRQNALGNNMSNAYNMTPYTFEILDSGEGELRGQCIPSALGHCVLVGGLCPKRPDTPTPEIAHRPSFQLDQTMARDAAYNFARLTSYSSKSPAELDNRGITPKEIELREKKPDSSEAAQQICRNLQETSLNLLNRIRGLLENGSMMRYNALDKQQSVMVYEDGGFGFKQQVGHGADGAARTLIVAPMVFDDKGKIQKQGVIREVDRGPAITIYTRADIDFGPNDEGILSLKGSEKPFYTPKVMYAGNQWHITSYEQLMSTERTEAVALAILERMGDVIKEVESI